MNLPDMLEDLPHKVVGDAFYFSNMDNNFYHNGPGISSSNIRRSGLGMSRLINA